METEEHYVIPTARKSKISHLLSWPIGAKRLSLELASVPQLKLLSLHFIQNWYDQTRDPRYPILSTIYLHNEIEFKSKATGEIVSTEWLIYVHPVRRQSRHRIQDYMLAEGIPTAAQWFQQRSDLCLRGGDRMNVFYEEEIDTFSIERETRLQPSREPKSRKQLVP